MTFYDLELAVARLAADPRVHPNTRIELQWMEEHRDAAGDPDCRSESAPLLHVVVESGTITLAAERVEPAIAR